MRSSANVSKRIKLYQTVSKCIVTYRSVLNCIKVYRNVSKRIETYRNVSKCIEMYRKRSEFIGTHPSQRVNPGSAPLSDLLRREDINGFLWLLGNYPDKAKSRKRNKGAMQDAPLLRIGSRRIAIVLFHFIDCGKD